MTGTADTSNGVHAPRKATRARSTISCLACKRRKQRCDRARPCSNCVSRHADLDCVYDAPKATKRPRLNTETVGTWAVRPTSKQRSPGSDEWTAEDAFWKHICKPSETLRGPHQASALYLTEASEEDQNVGADDELQALIKITSSSFPQQPGLGRSDPFDSLLVSARSPMFDFLIQHMRDQSDPFFGTLPPSSFQYPFSKIWMPLALKTDIGLLVTEYCASVNFDKQRRLDPQPYTVAAKSRLLNLLNEGLRSSKPFPDELIMAVYSLMYLVASEDFDVHWNGLVTMVNARGGLGVQGISGIVGNLVSVADRDFAALFEREPRLIRPRSYGATTEYSPHINMDSPLHPLHRPHVKLKTQPHLPHEVADVLQRLQKVTSMVIETFSALADITPSINQECQYLLDMTETSPVDQFNTRKEGLMYEALCIASRIYVRCILESTKFSKGFPEPELRNLQDILSTLSRNVWDTIPGVLLFIHLVAQPAARLIPTSKAYFLASQQRLVAPLALVMYPDTVLSLETFILVQRYIRMAASAKFANDDILLYD